jgi:hypothetical protein
MRNIDRYQNDLKSLMKKGDMLDVAIKYECYPENVEKQLKSGFKDVTKVKDYLSKIPSFKQEYQKWYSESLVLIKQLLLDRLNDFTKLFEKPKTRKSIEYGNYVIEDYLQGLRVTFAGETKVGPDGAISQFEQHLNIPKSVERRFESSLFDIGQLVQADLFDSELDAAKELNKNKFFRDAGAIVGVVLEKHLAQVLANHNLKSTKKNPSISELNDHLKTSGIYDTPTWRKIQHLGDIRNLCDHNKNREPKNEEVGELISEVDIIIKTVY